MKTAMKRVLSLALALSLLLALAGCGAGESGPALDFDPEGGYKGEYVLIYNPVREGAAGLSTGTLEGLVQTGAADFVGKEPHTMTPDSALFAQPDEYITEENAALDAGYDLAGGDAWAPGFQKVFSLDWGTPYHMLFEVAAVGEYCRVWSPVNPRFQPADAETLEALAAEIDAFSPALDAAFGPVPDIRGDGLVNVLCYAFSAPWIDGMTSLSDYYPAYHTDRGWERPGNAVAAIHLNTAAIPQGTDRLEDWSVTAAHELTHCRTILDLLPEGLVEARYARNEDTAEFIRRRDGGFIWISELLATAAMDVVKPGRSLTGSLSWWYAYYSSWNDLVSQAESCYAVPDRAPQHKGGSLFAWNNYRADYTAVALLGHFAENRGGAEVFSAIMDRWQAMGCVGDPVQAVWETLGYADFASFFADFLLSLLLHDEDFEGGRYRLEPFEGYDPATCGGLEDPLELLVPIVTETALTLGPASFTVIRPVDGVYTPPADAADGLRYVGVTLGG